MASNSIYTVSILGSYTDSKFVTIISHFNVKGIPKLRNGWINDEKSEEDEI